MTPTITAFLDSPVRGAGLARDMAVRWALEEVGQSHDVRLVSSAAFKVQAHIRLHAFGQQGGRMTPGSPFGSSGPRPLRHPLHFRRATFASRHRVG